MAQPPPEAAGGGGGGRERSARSPPRSASWNGDCGPEPPEDDGNEEGDGDGASAPDGPGPCGCRGERAAPRAPPPRDGSCALGCRRRTEPGPEEGDEDPGRATRRLRRRQRPRSAPKEKEESGRGRRGGGARLKALLEAALSPLCSCLSAGIGGTAPGGVRGWTRRVGLKAARGLRAGGELALRLLWMLCALLLLLLVLLLGALRLCWRLLAAGVSALGRTRLAELLDSAVLRRTRGFLGVNGTWWRLWARWRRWRSAPEELRAGCGTGDAVPGCDVGAPGSSAEEVSRLLAMAEVPEEELNPFQALGVEMTASDAELRKAYRRLAVLVRGGCTLLAASPGCSAESSVLSRFIRIKVSTRELRRPSRCCERRGTSSAAPRRGRSTRCECAAVGVGCWDKGGCPLQFLPQSSRLGGALAAGPTQGSDSGSVPAVAAARGWQRAS